MIDTEGATNWKEKSAKLESMCGNKRTPKALHTRWLREIGRIIDRCDSSLVDTHRAHMTTEQALSSAICEQPSHVYCETNSVLQWIR